MKQRNRIRAAVASLDLPPLTEEIFARTGWLPIAVCIAVRARLHPELSALVVVSATGDERIWSWSELEGAIDSTAAWLLSIGARPGSRIAVALPNGAGHIVVTQAAWRLGATVVPVDPSLPAASLAELVERVDAVTVVAVWPGALQPRSSPCGYRLADPHSILSTGGTLGAPRLAVQPGTLWGRLDGPPDRLRHGYGLADRQTQLVTLPLHHGFGFGYAHQYGLAYGHCLVIQESFDAEGALALIERWQIQVLATVPTALGRMARVAAFATCDLSSIEVLLHGAAPCPVAVKQKWMDRVGAHRVVEAYGATEVSIDCVIRGDEWLGRPGSVGRPVGCAIEIRGETGTTRPSGEVGEIYVRPVDPRAAHPDVIGAQVGAARAARPTGDVGYLDDEGYLYVVGRGALQLLCGGVTVHVEEVEATLAAHPDVQDVAVVGLAHEDLLEVPHALVCLEDGACSDLPELMRWCRERLTAAQVPRSMEIVSDLPRSPVGKLDRARVREIARSVG
jgi:Acyl-CoA synthetases (AMP-forming)/AMP-acid ligases II